LESVDTQCSVRERDLALKRFFSELALQTVIAPRAAIVHLWRTITLSAANIVVSAFAVPG